MHSFSECFRIKEKRDFHRIMSKMNQVVALREGEGMR